MDPVPFVLLLLVLVLVGARGCRCGLRCETTPYEADGPLVAVALLGVDARLRARNTCSGCGARENKVASLAAVEANNLVRLSGHGRHACGANLRLSLRVGLRRIWVRLDGGRLQR